MSARAWLAWLPGGTRRLAGRLLRTLLALPLLLLAMGAALWALAHGEAFSAWLLGRLPGLTVTEARGALLGDFQAERIDIALPRGGRLWLASPGWQDLRLVWDASAPWGVGVRAERVQADRLELNWVSDPASPPAVAPSELGLPVSLSVAQVHIGEAHSRWWGAPLRGVRLAMQLQTGQSGQGGAVHQLQVQALAWAGWHLGPEGMSVRMGAQAPLAVQLGGTWLAPEGALDGAPDAATLPVTTPAMPGALRVQAQGPLADLRVQAQARWLGGRGAADAKDAAPRAALSARVLPFAAWPLAELGIQASGLDLSRLQPHWPGTRIDGSVSLAPGPAQGLVLAVDVRNAVAKAWDQGGLPLLAAQGAVVAPQGQRLLDGAIEDLGWLGEAQADLRLTVPALPGNPVGTVTLQGVWNAREPVRVTLAGVQPQALHRAAPPLILQGSLSALPVWEAQRSPAPASSASASASASAPSALRLPQRVQVQAQLSGSYGREHARREAAASWPAARQPVSLSLDGEWRADAWSVQEMRLRAGAAGAEARLHDARLSWQGPSAWRAQGRLDIASFDPQVWLPWPQGMTGRNSLSAQGQLDIDQDGRGQAELSLLASSLGGLPLHGQASWRSGQGGPERRLLRAELDVAGNQVQLQGQGSHLAPHPEPHWLDGVWQLKVSAERLQALAPLGPLLGWQQLQGRVHVDAQAEHRGQGSALSGRGWRTGQGQLDAKALRLTTTQGEAVTLDATQADWRWSPLAGAAEGSATPVALQWQLQGLRSGQLQLDQARVSLEGSALAHRLRVEGDGRVPRQAGTLAAHLSLALDGGWQAQGQATGAGAVGAARLWRARLSQASLTAPATSAGPVATAGKPAQAPSRAELQAGAVLLQVQPTEIAWQDSGGAADGSGAGTSTLTVQPTRLQLLGAELALERLRWQGPVGAPHAADVLLQLAPLNLPQWLARWQPQAGWGGDLAVGGRLRMLRQAGQPWEIDAELARQSGDITLTEPTVEGQTAQRLGLREARFTLTARNGLWRAQQLLEGRVLGRLSGRQTVQARDPQAWPGPAAPLTGEVDMQVASLRPLATWAPAGWRLSGQLQGRAQMAGTLGTPRWSGWVQGEQLALSQALLGVHLSDGQLRIDLDGDRARLSRFVVTGGAQGGRVQADGEMSLSDSPRLQLHVQAERFAALQRIDRRIVLSGDTQVSFGADTLQVRGRIGVDEGLIDVSHADAPTLGDDVTVRRRPGVADDGAEGERNGNGNGNGTQRKLDADLALDLGRQLRLKGHGLDGLLVGQLQLSTPANKPAIRGVVRLEQGTFAAYGQKLRIERSTITFTGLIDNPRLDILAMRPQSPAADASDVRVGVRITGTALDPRIRLYSEPALSETEQLSWLVLGRGPSGLGGADIGLLQSAAVALLSGESREGPTDKLIGLLGLDQVSVRQSEGAVRDTVVNVGKQVSRHWYVGYERNLNATGGSWQLIYSLAQRFKLRGQAGEDNAVDLIWQWRWD